MKGKIVVAGAGSGGLVAAWRLGQAGYDVEIFEKSRRFDVGYDWHDDLSPQVFPRVGIPLIDERHYFKKNSWAFVSPDGGHITPIHQDPEKADLSMERRPLAEAMLALAGQVSEIHYGTPVDGLLTEKELVTGVMAGGKEVRADLVIDSCGVHSILRAQLPETYRIQRTAGPGEVFYAYRAFYNRREGTKDPQYRNKAYLRHLGEAGISWCILEPSGLVNVLVGRIDALPDNVLERALSALREDNPIIGDRVVRGGFTTAIPVRYPLSRMAGPGYAAVGDSAFMTIPMMGSGIASAMVAGHILGEVVIRNRDKPFSAESQWEYQVRVMREFGAHHTGIDTLKRWLLTADSDAISYLMRCGVIGADEMKTASTGEMLKLSPGQMIKKAVLGRRKLGFMLQLNSALNRSARAKKVALEIPEHYDEEAINRWQVKLDGLFSRS